MSYFMSRGLAVGAVAAGDPYVAIFQQGDVDPIVAEQQALGIVSIGVVLRSAVATQLSLFFTDGDGATFTSSLGSIELYPGADSTAYLGSVLTAGGFTQHGNCLRVVNVPASIGASVEWTWPTDAPLGVGAGLAPVAAHRIGVGIWNSGAGAGADLDVYFRWAEGAIISPPWRWSNLVFEGTGA